MIYKKVSVMGCKKWLKVIHGKVINVNGNNKTKLWKM